MRKECTKRLLATNQTAGYLYPNFIGDIIQVSVKKQNVPDDGILTIYEISATDTVLIGRSSVNDLLRFHNGLVFHKEVGKDPYTKDPFQLLIKYSGKYLIELEKCHFYNDGSPAPDSPLPPFKPPNNDNKTSCKKYVFGNLNMSHTETLVRSGTESIFVGDSIEIRPTTAAMKSGRIEIYDIGFNFARLIATYNLDRGAWKFTRKVENFKGYGCYIKYVTPKKNDFIELEICKIFTNTPGPEVTPVPPINRSCSTNWLVPNGIIAQRLTRPGTNSTFSADTIEIKSIAKQDGAQGSVEIYDTGYNFQTLLATYPMSTGWTFTRSVGNFKGYQVTIKRSGKGLIQLQSCHISRGV